VAEILARVMEEVVKNHRLIQAGSQPEAQSTR